ncbi:hypothetical protein BDA99DRAFT_560245 [Phascolomyces articulosus]|uniref:F-box domain-containing protein n=1 Tax=Phascolomyces articulosus TaxID=60185 RepID=A0AAD5JZY0_9FUNG|nr:hypothetical protein BDA99DRAFT_560245 [Phascolomyces articulosus]
MSFKPLPLTTYNELLESFDKCNDALNKGYFMTAVQHATNGLDNLKKFERAFLTMRSTAYQQQGEFNQALNDAVMLQKQPFPFDSQGYIAAAQILYQQAKMEETIQTCDMLVSHNDTYRMYMAEVNIDQLILYKTLAIQRMKHRSDPVKKLSFDTLVLILNDLLFDDIIHCLHVSKAWQASIIHCASIKCLHKLLVTGKWVKNNQHYPGNRLCKSISLISNHVRELDVLFDSKEVQETLGNVPFHHLRSLGIVERGVMMHKEQLLSFLKNSSDTLEQITFGCENAPSIHQVLSICLNLKTLTYSSQASSDAFEPFYNEGQQRLLKHPSLTRLTLVFSRIREKQIRRILKITINLKELTICGCDSMAIGTLSQYGNHIQHITIGNPDFTLLLSNAESTISYPNQDINNNGCGINLLSSKFIDTNRFHHHTVDVSRCDTMTAGLLLSLLESKNQIAEYKVEALSISTNKMNDEITSAIDNGLHDWHRFSTFHSQHLRSFKITFSKSTEAIFASVIQQCPALEEICLQGSSLPTHVLYTAMKSLRALRCLGIGNMNDNGEDIFDTVISTAENQQHMRSFFEYHVLLLGSGNNNYNNNCNRSSLEQVRLSSFSYLETETWRMLLRIGTLRSLCLMGLHLLDEPDVELILDTLTKSPPPLLEDLTICYLDNVKDHNINRMDFTCIRLKHCYFITTSGLIHLCNNAKKLKELEIRFGHNIEREPIEILTRKRNIRLIWKGY